jgi:hypothetical protein
MGEDNLDELGERLRRLLEQLGDWVRKCRFLGGDLLDLPGLVDGELFRLHSQRRVYVPTRPDRTPDETASSRTPSKRKAPRSNSWQQSPAGLFGYSHMLGAYPGGQAEYLHIQFQTL